MGNNKSDINKRFTEIINRLILSKTVRSKAEIAEILDIGKSKLSEITNERMNVSAELIADLCSMYENINPSWILTGGGEMFFQPTSNVLEDGEIEYGKKSGKTDKKRFIPVYSLKSSGSLASLLYYPESYMPVDYIFLPITGKYDGAVQIFEDYMYPLIKSGDIVVYRKINDIENNIFWGEMYLLSYDWEGEEYVAIKYIQKSDIDDKYIRLVSRNTQDSPKDIPFSGIKVLAQVKACVQTSIAKLR